MQLIKEEITEKFIESMVDKVIARLGEKFETLDISLDYIAAVLSDQSPAALGVQQAAIGRYARPTKRARDGND
tara:strand:+ start:207 stop:425 length:219 start_codon:yes stop_codon:yes gene_type:complete